MASMIRELAVRIFALICVVTLCIGAPAFAETSVNDSTANLLQPVGPWNLNGTQAECQLIRQFGSEVRGLVVMLSQGAGPSRFDAVLAGNAITKLPKHTKLQLQLLPNGQTFAIAAESAGIPNKNERFVRWFDADASILEDLRSTEEVSLTNGKDFDVLP
jgi:hypothetical protein